jgi:hypothetical protein
MQQSIETRPVPVHLWIVGVVALLWNGFGCYDYMMTRMRDADYLKSMMPDVDPANFLAYVDSLPIWASAGWGLGVWMGLLGSVLLLMRSRWAIPVYLLSFIGAVVGLGYQMSDPMPGLTTFMAIGIPSIIIAVCLGLFLYARAQGASGVLR